MKIEWKKAVRNDRPAELLVTVVADEWVSDKRSRWKQRLDKGLPGTAGLCRAILGRVALFQTCLDMMAVQRGTVSGPKERLQSAFCSGGNE